MDFTRINRNNIETTCRLPALLKQKNLGSMPHFLLLGRSHAGKRTAKLHGSTRSYFNKYHAVAIAHNEINLAAFTQKIFLCQTQAGLLQIVQRL